MALAKTVQKMIGSSAAILMTMMLFACMTATPYQPEIAGQKISGGYSETRLDDGRYRVNFAGNSLTSRDRVEGYLLYRAAELTIQDGYDWFRLIDHTTERDRRTYVERYPRYRPYFGSYYDYWRPHWRYYRGRGWTDWHPYGGDPFWSYDVDVRTIERFDAHAEIKMGKGQMPGDGERVFDARKVVADLKPTIEWPREN